MLPFGSDFDAEELDLLPTMGVPKAAAGDLAAMVRLAATGVSVRGHEQVLARLGLDRPKTPREWLTGCVARGALTQAATTSA